mgnify:CR=1 FL=1
MINEKAAKVGQRIKIIRITNQLSQAKVAVSV